MDDHRRRKVGLSEEEDVCMMIEKTFRAIDKRRRKRMWEEAWIMKGGGQAEDAR